MSSFSRKYYHNEVLGIHLQSLYHLVKDRLIPEVFYVKWMYKKKTGKKLDLQEPKTLNEKICWLKLYDRTPLHTQCADKFAVRDYITERIGAKYLIPLYFHTKDPSEINASTITRLPCIIKTNHDSGGGIFVKDKKDINWTQIQKKLKNRLARNYYYHTKEWQYKHIEPRILVEKLLVDQHGNIPEDYKLHVINGRVRMIQVDVGRGTDNHRRNWYAPNWEREPYKWSSPKGAGKYTDPSETDVEKPKTLGEMVKLSEVLASPFPYVRIDWYDVDGRLFFGEITFHHDGGYQRILPESWDYKLGSLLKLP